MTEKEFVRLLRFYLACIDAEDRRSLTKKLSALHDSVVSPWETEELLFHLDASEAPVQVHLESDFELLRSGIAPEVRADRFFYGYPTFLDEHGLLSPLFFTHVEVAHVEDRRFVIRSGGPPQLNHHAFRRHHAQPEELQEIKAALEGRFGSFALRLHAAFDALGVPTPPLARCGLEPFPCADRFGARWVNRPILFRSERSLHTRHLRRELEALADDPALCKALVSTAAGVIAGVSPHAAEGSARKGQPPPLHQVLPLNHGQESAARVGLRAPLTVVTGPPGTGKSQVVVDILASCALARLPVLFSSKNNKAVDVVRDRLRSTLGRDHDWALRLGSRQMMAEARDEMSGRLEVLCRPHMEPTATTRPTPPREPVDHVDELDETIERTERRIEKVEDVESTLAELDWQRLVARSAVDPALADSWPRGHRPLPDRARVERLTATVEALAGLRSGGFWPNVWRAIGATPIGARAIARRLHPEFASLASVLPPRVHAALCAVAAQRQGYPFIALANACGRLARLVSWRAAESAFTQAADFLAAEPCARDLSEHLTRLKQRRARAVASSLGAAWTARVARNGRSLRQAVGRYFDLSSRARQSRPAEPAQVLGQFTSAVRGVAADLPVWIVTNLSVRNALPLEPALFELVIVDEASQCDIPSALPLLFRARRALVIGDPRQLRHISTLPLPEETTLAQKHGVAGLLGAWSYNATSLYALAERTALERSGAPLFLSEHYRSHPQIIQFSNHAFYQQRLVVRTDVAKLGERLDGEPLGFYWHDVRGAVSRSPRSAVNEPEVQAIVALLDEWSHSGFLLRRTVEFGIVTPFRLQMERLATVVRARPWWDQVNGRLTVGTAHQFQGDERDVMIFSPGVAAGMAPRLVRWVADTDQLLNVAVTRARAALHVVGDLPACVAAGGFLGAFARTAMRG